ncbi:MAG: ATP-dependent helicase [Bradymonadaceae bacterium]|nr:ATP-dependent helicase [Lujinxingiaceae bacterium]
MKRYTLKPVETHARKLDYEAVLNAQQLAVVTAGAGPLLVIAGAGSGKTHTLTYRMAYLVERGVAPDRIMLLTFTNRAARAMTTRAASLIGADAARMWGGTFHSVANRILRREAKVLGYPDDYTIIDQEDAQTLMKACLTEANVGHLERRFPTEKVLLRILSFCINSQQKVEQVVQEKYPYFLNLAGQLRSIFRLYQTRKLEMGLMDFDDLLLNWKKLLSEHEDLRAKYAAQFEHVLVDEYQDTNHIQGEIVDLMASVHGNVMVVGDDCQSIYAFRGADYRNILEFPKRFDDCKQFKLETNYRSTPEILELANRSIAHNTRQFQKTLRAERRSGALPVHVRLKDANQQARFVCQRILELIDEGMALPEIAVLYRSHHHSLELQVEMTRAQIPFVVRSGLRFFEQAHIKDVLAYLRFVYNPKDELAFMRLARQWYGIGQKRAQDIWMFASSQTDALEAVSDQRLIDTLGGQAASSWTQAAGLLTTLRGQRLSESPAEMIAAILESEYKEFVQSSYENAENRMSDLEQLASYADQFKTLDEFLGEVSLLATISGQEIGVGEAKPDEFVCLSSVHQAKGLEWGATFVLWLSDGEFPHASAAQDIAQLEEERRLFYVAATRAKNELYLCHPFTRTGRDRFTTVLRESKFVEELKRGGQKQPFEDWAIDA